MALKVTAFLVSAEMAALGLVFHLKALGERCVCVEELGDNPTGRRVRGELQAPGTPRFHPLFQLA